MTRYTRIQVLQQAEQMENQEVFMRGRTRGSRKVGVNSNNEDNCPQVRDENSQTKDSQLTKIIEQAGPEWNLEHPKSRLTSSGDPS